MRFLFKTLILPFYRRWALRQISRERVFFFEKMRLVVPSGVFHPGVFFSTPLFISFLKKQRLAERRILDVGTGSGLLALWSARAGAEVVAIDINPLAVETARQNAEANSLKINVLESDLFNSIPLDEPFDFILINPPYYSIEPKTTTERAFFAGPNHEYFERLFRQMPAHLAAPDGLVWMILSEDCDFAAIQFLAEKQGWKSKVVWSRQAWGERFVIFEFEI